MDREQVLAIIDSAYEARMTNDREALKTFWAEGAEFDFAGETGLLEAFLGRAGPAPGQEAVESIMELVTMTAIERVQAVVEETRAAILSRAWVSFAGRAPFETLIYDLWELDDQGKVTALLQFTDTAKIASEMQAPTGTSVWAMNGTGPGTITLT